MPRHDKIQEMETKESEENETEQATTATTEDTDQDSLSTGERTKEPTLDPFAYNQKTNPSDVPLQLLDTFVALCHDEDDPNHEMHGTTMIRKLLSVEESKPDWTRSSLPRLQTSSSSSLAGRNTQPSSSKRHRPSPTWLAVCLNISDT